MLIIQNKKIKYVAYNNKKRQIFHKKKTLLFEIYRVLDISVVYLIDKNQIILN